MRFMPTRFCMASSPVIHTRAASSFDFASDLSSPVGFDSSGSPGLRL